MRGGTVLAAVIVAVVVLDSLAKVWVERTLSPLAPVPVIGQALRLTLSFNTGVAFSLFADTGQWPLVFEGTVMLLLALTFIAAIIGAHAAPITGKLPLRPMGLILGGGLANFLERLAYGRVTDYLDLGIGIARWPTFNVADCCIVMGAAALALRYWQYALPGRPPNQPGSILHGTSAEVPTAGGDD